MTTYRAVNQTSFVRLENTSGNHNKFYRLQLVELENGEFLCSTNWGSIGSEGQSKHYRYPSESAARSKADSIVSQKQGKGYRVVGSSFLNWQNRLSKARTPEGEMISCFEHEVAALETRSRQLIATFAPPRDLLPMLSYYLLELADGRWLIKIVNHSSKQACQIASYLTAADALRRIEQETRALRDEGYRNIDNEMTARIADQARSEQVTPLEGQARMEDEMLASISHFDVEERRPLHRLGRSQSPERLISLLRLKTDGRWAVERYDCDRDAYGYSYHDREEHAIERVNREIKELQRKQYKEIPLASTNVVKLEGASDRRRIWAERRFDQRFAVVVKTGSNTHVIDLDNAVAATTELCETLKGHLAINWQLCDDSSVSVAWDDIALAKQIRRDETLQALIEELREIVSSKPKSRFTTWL